ncbi:serine/threonine protein kinase [Lusitaniella coriacea]|uniref:serine/threonine protein kinase n=1 Tax=Lusitaniella coriacea TaxID=1983105 RepID=UPI003CE8F670
MLQSQQILKNRYRLQQQLGNNAGRQTWQAEDISTSPSSSVIVKLLAFSPQMQWEEYKLFEREAQVLQSLNHPKLPQYRDSFSLNLDAKEGLSWFGLVQDYIEGQSLQNLLNSGYRFSNKQVRSIAIQVLEILRNLHELDSPILHRDIKPSNLILSEDKQQVYLVDFGAVCDATTIEGATFTVVGTAGYAPLEQFWGKAIPASDLYALGATLIHLLVGIPPSELPQKSLRLDFRDKVSLNPKFLRWIETLTEPDLDRRFSSAAQALEALKTGSTLPQKSKPANSNIHLKKYPNRLTIKIPKAKRSLKRNLRLYGKLLRQLFLVLASRIFFLLPVLMSILMILFVLGGTLSGNFTIYAWILPPILIGVLWWSWKRNKLEISKIFTELNQIAERQVGLSSIVFSCRFSDCTPIFFIEPPLRLLGVSIGHHLQHLVSDITNIEAIPWEGVVIEMEQTRYVLGRHLEEMEREWLVQEIKDWIARQTQTG